MREGVNLMKPWGTTFRPADIVVASVMTCLLVASGVVTAGSAAEKETQTATSAPTAVIARAALRDVRTVLIARRARDGTATVRLRVFERDAGRWRRTGTVLVGERRKWFWNVVRAPAAVCDFAVASSPRTMVRVRLLVSASIGCGAATHHFHVETGQLAPG